MPGFDGTGPRRSGPFSGGGRGYCAVVLPRAPGVAPYGYVGLDGIPYDGEPSPEGAMLRPESLSDGRSTPRGGLAERRGRGRGRCGWR